MEKHIFVIDMERIREPKTYRSVREELGSTLRACGPETGVIFAWAWMLNLGLTLLWRQEQLPKLGVLTEENLQDVAVRFYREDIFYSALRSRECGAACAEELLEQIGGRAEGQLRLFHPEVDEVKNLFGWDC